MARDVTITYRNDLGNDQPQVVMFFENTASPPVAWQVVDHAGYGGWHRAQFTCSTAVTAASSLFGATGFTVQYGGALLALARSDGGAVALEQTGAAAQDLISVTNLVEGGDPLLTVTVTLAKDGAPILRTTIPLTPGAIAAFPITRVITFATSSGLHAGDEIDPAALANITSFAFTDLDAITIVLTKDEAGVAIFMRTSPP